jgi:pilus assembly protein CpaC
VTAVGEFMCAASANRGAKTVMRLIKILAPRPAWRGVVLAGLLAAAGGWLPSSPVTAQTTIVADDGLQLEVGKTRLFVTPSVYSEVTIDDPKIADVTPLSKQSMNIIGKGIGTTNLTIFGPDHTLISTTTIFVGPDVGGMKTQLHESLPHETEISVRAVKDHIVLSGVVSNSADLARAVELAEAYAPKKVVNLLAVEGVQQVMLSVRFVEMERSVAKNLRLNVNQGYTTNANGQLQNTGNIGIFTGDNLLNAAKIGDTIGGGFLRFGSGISTFEAILDALETKQVTKTLAEPTLVAMSGDTASFLVGGEIPIPVNDTIGTTGLPLITVDFKQYGIALAFTPTVLKNGMINLVVNPEVSEIDYSTTYNENGVNIPGFKVRRAKTTVELRDGESFVIAGLLSDNYTDTIRALPFAGDVPILGALFKSTGFQKDRSELVIVVTPHLAVPRRGPIATPVDHFVPPSDYELFLFGSMVGPAGAVNAEDRALMSQDPSKGGVEGPYGHVVY